MQTTSARASLWLATASPTDYPPLSGPLEGPAVHPLPRRDPPTT